MRKLFTIVLIISLLVSPILYQFVLPGLIKTDDGIWMVVRLSAFFHELSVGQFPVRFLNSLNHGYGYPVANFLYPMPFYVGSLIHKMGFNFIDSTKILFATSALFGAAMMYFWVNAKFGKLSGIVGSFLYLYTPYFLFDIFVRGSLGEIFSLAIIPACLFFADLVLTQKSRLGFIFFSTSIFFLITSHNVMTLIFVPLITVYGFIGSWDSHKTAGLYQFFIGILFGLFSSSFFWGPALTELSYTVSSKISVSDPSQYFINHNFQYIFLLGLSTVAVILTAFFTSLSNKFKDKTVLLLSCFCVGAIFLSSSYSSIIWGLVPLNRLVQFPWRFLSLLVILIPYLGGWIVYRFKNYSILIVIILTIFTAISIYSLNLNISREFFPDTYYSANDDSTTVKNEYMPKWVVTKPGSRPNDEVSILNGKANVSGSKVVAIDNVRIQINKVYYPGLEIYINGNKGNFDYQSSGFPQINLQPGSYDVSWKFVETPLRILFDLVSLLSFVGLFFYSLILIRSKK